MAGIGRRALYLALRMNLDRKLPKVQRVHAAAVLHNIHKEPGNRTRFYKAELRYKAAGTVRKKKSSEAPKAPKVDPLTRVRGKSARGARPATASAAAAGAGAGSAGMGGGGGGLGMMYWGGGGYGSDGYGSGPEPEESMTTAEKENAEEERERRATASPALLSKKNRMTMPIAPILNLDDEDRLELRNADAQHRQHGEHLMRWMDDVFPAKPNKSDRLNNRKNSAAAAETDEQQRGNRNAGGGDGGFLPNISSSGGGVVAKNPYGSNRPDSAFESKRGNNPNLNDTSRGQHQQQHQRRREKEQDRAADVRLQRRMCRPVNRIWAGSIVHVSLVHSFALD